MYYFPNRLAASSIIVIVAVAPQRLHPAAKGVESAANAGMQAVVITGLHSEEEFAEFDNIVRFVKNYEDLLVSDLQK